MAAGVNRRCAYERDSVARGARGASAGATKIAGTLGGVAERLKAADLKSAVGLVLTRSSNLLPSVFDAHVAEPRFEWLGYVRLGSEKAYSSSAFALDDSVWHAFGVRDCGVGAIRSLGHARRVFLLPFPSVDNSWAGCGGRGVICGLATRTQARAPGPSIGHTGLVEAAAIPAARRGSRGDRRLVVPRLCEAGSDTGVGAGALADASR